MAAMDQTKLTNMVNAINNEASNYVTKVNGDVKNLLETFNTNWCSGSAQALATEISECLNNLATRIKSTFDNKDQEIKQAVKWFNDTETEDIYYPGLSFGKPDTSLSLNDKLPNGKVGVADGADLSTINTPMNTLVTDVTGSLDSIVTTVKSADAFSIDEQNSLTNGVNKIKTDFVNAMAELENSLKTRMSGEIDTRNKLNAANRDILGA